MEPTAGRIVNFAMKDGSFRPFLIVFVFDKVGDVQHVNGQLFTDGTNDATNYPANVPDPGAACKSPIWVTSASEGTEPGSWSWPDTGAKQAKPKPVPAAPALSTGDNASPAQSADVDGPKE